MPDEPHPPDERRAGDGAAGGLELQPLALEPLTLPPGLATQTIARPPVVADAARAEAPVRDGPRLGRPIALSIAIHVVVLFVVWLLLPVHRDPPEEPVVRANLIEWHWIGENPEGEGSGPRGPVPEKPVHEEAKGKPVAGGFLDDAAFQKGSASVPGGAHAAAAGSMFAGRLDGKEGLVAAGGGDGETEGAVRLALDWLARHQQADGTWNSRSFEKRCQGPGCDGSCDEPYVAATTALALLPYLGAGHTWRDGPWKEVVRRGLNALHRLQRKDGSFDDGSKQGYADAICLLAVAEAYGLTGDPDLAAMARKSVAYFAARQSRSGGWRYEPGDGDADSSVTAWVSMGLSAAKRAGLAVPEATLQGARGWFREHTDGDGYLGYRSTGIGSTSMLAAGYFVPLMLGERPESAMLQRTASRLDSALPRWPRDADDPGTGFGPADPMHWYYGALAAFQCDGGTWRVWNERLKRLLLDHIERGGCSAGSWSPVGSTGAKGGRIVVTALCAMSLEVYYRYPRATAVR